MTGREKIEAAFSKAGTPEIPAVIPYEDIYIRDHWDQLTSYPWWHQYLPDIESQILWFREFVGKTGQDWMRIYPGTSREDRQNLSLKVREDGVFRIDRRTGREEKLTKPMIGGWTVSGELQSYHPPRLAESPEEIDELIPLGEDFDRAEFLRQGRHDLATAFLKEFGNNLYPTACVPSPLWCLPNLWGFEGMMIMIGTRPDLVEYASRRYLALAVRTIRESAALGVEAIWVEECLTDMLSPATFKTLNVPLLQQLLTEIHLAGMKSIYYFCGNPAGKWEDLLSVGADALALEESKKGFVIDIEEVVEQVKGRMTLLGNLDAVHLLEKGSEEEIRAEISRQISAGRRNGGRFIMSLGSPVTPGTSVERVRRYCERVHEIGVPS
jgi:hypothetical protein